MNNSAAIIIDTINRVYMNGLTTTSGGNLSVRDSEGNIYITPSGKDKGTLRVEDVCKIRPDGTVEGAFKPSIELPFHSLIYKLRPDVNAVLHVHSPYLVSFSLLNSAPEIKILPSMYNSCGNVGLSEYDIPGSIELGRQIAKYIEQGYDSVMMQNHGVVLVAGDMQTAYKKLENLENCAKICYNARLLGKKVNILSEEDMQAYCRAQTKRDFLPAEEYADGEKEAREQMCAFSARCYSHKLFSVCDGVISVKLSDGSFLITPAEYDRMSLKEEEIVKIKDGKAYGGEPDASYALHGKIYNEKPFVNSIMKASPTAIMAYGVTDEYISSRTIPESYIMMRDLVRLPYGADINGGEELIAKLSPATPVALIANSSVITTGESIVKAFDRLEVTDVTATNLLLTRALGTPCNITDAEIEKIDIAFNLPR